MTDKNKTGSDWDTFGTFASGASDIAGIWSNYQLAGAAKDQAKTAEKSRMFKGQMDLAGIMQALDNQNAKRSFFGNDDTRSITDYLPQSVIDQYGMGGQNPGGNNNPAFAQPNPNNLYTPFGLQGGAPVPNQGMQPNPESGYQSFSQPAPAPLVGANPNANQQPNKRLF